MTKRINIEDLNIAFNNTSIDKNKYILHHADGRCGKKVCIAQKTEHGSISPQTDFLTYSEMNQLLRGLIFASNGRVVNTKETRVYLVDHDTIGESEYDFISDEAFMDLAEEQGTIYSLKGFEDFFNSQLSISDCYIRII